MFIRPAKHRRKWDRRFLELAAHVGSWSKDPSTRVGCVIVDDKQRVVSMGYNGFPRGVRDDNERYAKREIKLSMTVHAEANALLNSVASVEGCTLYVTPLCTCNDCAKLVIQAGIQCVVFPTPIRPQDWERWNESTEVAMAMYKEARIKVRHMIP